MLGGGTNLFNPKSAHFRPHGRRRQLHFEELLVAALFSLLRSQAVEKHLRRLRRHL